jgi:hypothetical protein
MPFHFSHEKYMGVVVLLIVAGMLGFAVVSAIREIRVYRKALKGDELYLVSSSRLKRRLLISMLLVVETIFLIIGVFFFTVEKPYQELLFWAAPLFLIFLLIHLSVRDFRETSRDIDRIFKEARSSALTVVKKQKRA